MRRVYGEKVGAQYPGRSASLLWLLSSRDGGMSMQKSAEGIVVAAHSDEGPNLEGRRDAETSMDEGDAQRKAEKPDDSRNVAGGTRKDTARERPVE